MSISYQQPRGGKASGYSLVEVMVAVGIVSFGIIAMVSMMPSGLSTFRNSMDRSISSQIAQRIVNEARQTDFTTLIGYSGNASFEYRYFTDEGDEVKSGDGKTRVYAAFTEVTNPIVITGTSGNFTNSSIARIRVRVANNPRAESSEEVRNSIRNVSPIFWPDRSPTPSTYKAPSVTDFTALIPKM